MPNLSPSEIPPRPSAEKNQTPAHPIEGIGLVLFLGIVALLGLDWASPSVSEFVSAISVQDLPRMLLGR